MKTKNKEKTILASNEKTSETSRQLFHANKKILIDIDNLGITLGGEKILDNVSFCVHKGEFIGLIGQNGAGKTTLLNVLLGLLPSTEGKVHVEKSAIGFIPQHGYAHNTQVPISVMEVVQLGARGDKNVALAALKDVRMESYARKRIDELSGGQQQRVLIAKALASHPQMLILDEPTTGIDEQSQAEFYTLLSSLQAKGLTIIMVSHDVDAVLKLVSRVLCLNRTVLYDGPPEHFEADKYLANIYGDRHRLLHHQHVARHEEADHA